MGLEGQGNGCMGYVHRLQGDMLMGKYRRCWHEGERAGCCLNMYLKCIHGAFTPTTANTQHITSKVKEHNAKSSKRSQSPCELKHPVIKQTILYTFESNHEALFLRHKNPMQPNSCNTTLPPPRHPTCLAKAAKPHTFWHSSPSPPRSPLPQGTLARHG
jgi:hypothetical protein